jgi:oxygen-independent coproporphyrinogen-3 oxidase
MAGIYLHIPYCRQACHYCNFHFSTTLKSKEQLLKALEKEILLRKDFLQDEIIDTIYFGGGTPSILDKNEIQTLMQAIRKNFTISENAEITLEANPEDVTQEIISCWKDLGINRLSIGIQSFDNQKLKWMNRSHDQLQAKNAIKNALNYGIKNISIDFIFNLPHQTIQELEQDISFALEAGIKHISIYGLTVEEKTVLAKFQKNGTFVNEEDKGADLYEGIMNFMHLQNWVHYEISNFAMNGDYISRHNSSYWKGIPYLGIGPSAHSFNGELRWFNLSNNAVYAKQIMQENLAGEWESLEEYQRFNEKILLGFRTHSGLSLNEIQNQFSTKYFNHLMKIYHSIKKNDWIIEKENHLILSRKGMLLADHITALFFFNA